MCSSDLIAVVHLVLHGDVVTSLALFTGQGDLDSLFVLRHCLSPFSLYFSGFTPLLGSGGGSRTLDTTIMSRVL